MLIIRDNHDDSTVVWDLEERNPLFDQISGQNFEVSKTSDDDDNDNDDRHDKHDRHDNDGSSGDDVPYIYESDSGEVYEEGPIYELINSIFMKTLYHEHLRWPVKCPHEGEIIDFISFTY